MDTTIKETPTRRVIRHVCDGHEYRFDTVSGAVTNNYGTTVARINTEPHQYQLFIDGKIKARLSREREPTTEQIAEFAIGQTAFHNPQGR